MFKKIQHIGLVVKSIDETLEKWKPFGAVEAAPRLHGEEHGQISALVQIGESYFELMEPVGDVGVVPKYYKTHGEGFHHFGFLVSSTDEVCAELDKCGINLIGKTVGDGRDGGFVHPKHTGGYVFEISEVADLERDINKKPEF